MLLIYVISTAASLNDKKIIKMYVPLAFLITGLLYIVASKTKHALIEQYHELPLPVSAVEVHAHKNIVFEYNRTRWQIRREVIEFFLYIFSFQHGI